MQNKKVLVVFSGGQDSTTCLGWALENFSDVSTITFDYGQRHKAEVAAAMDVIDFFETKLGKPIPHDILTLPVDVFAGSSPLTNKNEQLERYENHDAMEAIIGDRIEKTFVPMRNAVFLMLAANRAAVLGATEIITGVCQGDNANYPDCRQPFIWDCVNTINKALGRSQGEQGWINISTPLMLLSKAETVAMAKSIPHTYAALAYSHTAYDGSFPPKDDHASILRAYGFQQAGVPDPLIVRAHWLGLCALPGENNYNEILVASVVNDMAEQWAAA